MPPVTLFILLATLLASFYFLVQAEGGFEEIPRLLQRVGIEWPFRPIPQPVPATPAPERVTQPTPIPGVPREFYSGSSRFSQGSCVQDSDCQPAGCSGEVCSNDPNIVSTCEFSENFPNNLSYRCGCVQGSCGWR